MIKRIRCAFTEHPNENEPRRSESGAAWDSDVFHTVVHNARRPVFPHFPPNSAAACGLIHLSTELSTIGLFYADKMEPCA